MERAVHSRWVAVPAVGWRMKCVCGKAITHADPRCEDETLCVNCADALTRCESKVSAAFRIGMKIGDALADEREPIDSEGIANVIKAWWLEKPRSRDPGGAEYRVVYTEQIYDLMRRLS